MRWSTRLLTVTGKALETGPFCFLERGRSANFCPTFARACLWVLCFEAGEHCRPGSWLAKLPLVMSALGADMTVGVCGLSHSLGTPGVLLADARRGVP